METLVIDTDAVRRRLLEKVLEQRGHIAIAHSSMEAALAAYHRAPFPLVLTSRWLGPTDGLDVCRRIRAHPSPSTFLIVLAWDDAPEDVQAVLAAGADDYVTAPTCVDLLSLRIAFATRHVERTWTSALTVRTAMAALDQTTRTSEDVAMRLEQVQRPPSSAWHDDAGGIPFGFEQAPPISLPSPRAFLDAGASVDGPDLRTATTHEIRAPAQAVAGVIRRLLETDLTPEQRTLAEKARRSVETQLAIADGVIDASRLDSGHLALASLPFDLRALVDEVVAMLEPDATAKGVELTVRYAHAAPRRVIGDARRLRQILLTLAGNAVGFTRPGRVLINVRSEERTATDARIRITVTDRGPGLAADVLARLLDGTAATPTSMAEPQQTHGAPATSLAICKRLIDLMDGRIGATSEPGAGSTFWLAVRLPVIGEPEVSDQHTSPVSSRAAQDNPAPIRARVLVAEGDPLSREMTARMLAHLGCIVDVATSRAEAVLMLAQYDHDILFIAAPLAETGGVDVIAAARRHASRHGQVSIVVVGQHDDRERWLADGVTGYLSKPVTLRDIRVALARWSSPRDTTGPAPIEPDPDAASLDATPPRDVTRTQDTPAKAPPGRAQKTDKANRSGAVSRQVRV